MKYLHRFIPLSLFQLNVLKLLPKQQVGKAKSENVHTAADNDEALNDEIEGSEGKAFILLIVNFLTL